MKKLLLVSIIALFTLSACIPSFLGGGGEEAPAAAPAVDLTATIEAMASTQAVETVDALATPTLEPETPTVEPTTTSTETMIPTEEETKAPTETNTPEVDAEATTTETAESGTPDATPTATLEMTATPEETGTPAPTSTSVYPSATSPIAINLPPENLVPYRRVDVKNKTKGNIYISLQGVTEYNYKPVIEYDIPRQTSVKYRVPEGYYKIVVYIGNNPMVEYVRISSNTSLQITIRQDELKIEK